MNKDKQRIAIAEACGWHVKRSATSPDQTLVSQDGHNFYAIDILPDYLNDLNAIHEAEKTLNHEQRNRYINILDAMPDDSDPVQHDFQWCCSAAEQRAEAFLRATGKWEESE